MTEYIYFVKCPDCDDESFMFFDEAKAFAASCLSRKPIITQTEVCRNDFGECTDHCDLGTVWTWENAVGDISCDEPAVKIFTSGDFADYNPDRDPEFLQLDNALDSIPDNFCNPIDQPRDSDAASDRLRKPIPEGMTIEQLVEEMEENEDTVECTICNDLFPKDQCRKEVNLGYLCSRCADGVMSRGETLTFKENNYRDLLDESIEDEKSLSDLVKDSINHLTNDLGKDPWADDFADDVISDIERNYETFVPEDFNKYQKWCSEVACEVSRQVNRGLTEDNKGKQTTLTEGWDVNDTVELDYGKYTYDVVIDDVITLIWENYITDEDVKDIPGGLETIDTYLDKMYLDKDSTLWDAFWEDHFDDLLYKYYDKVLDKYREDAREKYRENSYDDEIGRMWDDAYEDWLDRQYSEDFDKKPAIKELRESENQDFLLVICPECGTNNLDPEINICNNCGVKL